MSSRSRNRFSYGLLLSAASGAAHFVLWQNRSNLPVSRLLLLALAALISGTTERASATLIFSFKPAEFWQLNVRILVGRCGLLFYLIFKSLFSLICKFVQFDFQIFVLFDFEIFVLFDYFLLFLLLLLLY